MADRTELMEAALASYPEGIALLDCEGRVVYWIRAAEQVSGFPGVEIVGRAVPSAIEPLLEPGGGDDTGDSRERGMLVRAQHRLGVELSALTRNRVLRDALGARIGSIVTFRLADRRDALPRGANATGAEIADAQGSLEERMDELFADFTRDGVPLGLLWITIDQGSDLRRTHGARACESMLERVETTLANGAHPGEQIGRWGDDEFLMLSHAPTADALGTRAQLLAGLARTTDFRWWGDRVSITASIGAAHAESGETLIQLLERTQAAMHTSMHAGGNHITLSPGRRACSPS